MDILTKITLTLLILSVTSFFRVVTGLAPNDKWENRFVVSFVVSIGGLILCLIAYVWLE